MKLIVLEIIIVSTEYSKAELIRFFYKSVKSNEYIIRSFQTFTGETEKPLGLDII